MWTRLDVLSLSGNAIANTDIAYCIAYDINNNVLCKTVETGQKDAKNMI